MKHWKAILVITTFLGYVFILEPNILTVTRLTLADEGEETAIKLAFFADIHIWTKKPLYSSLLKRLEDEDVDLILFGGDVLSPYTNMNYFRELFIELGSIAPMYSIYGNWEESETGIVDAVFKEAGINVLHTRSTLLEIGGKKIGITGVPSHHYFSWTRFLPEGDYDMKILLIHAPNLLEKFPDILNKFDLVLAGHTHGGQFYIPWVTEALLKSGRGFSGDFFRGLYEYNDTKIYVTRGLGGWFPGRLASPPELVIIEF